MYDRYGGFPEYVPVWKRRQQAQKKIAKLRKQGKKVSPIAIEGRQIASTIWGQAWCRNLESYSDYSNRLPRGRTYVRNGSVIDLQIEKGAVAALVSGSDIYTVRVAIKPIDRPRWRPLVRECAGKIDSVVELLSGKLSGGVMEVLCRKPTGLFPSTKEISLSCSCPDGAWLCKHLAAVLYGVGARLDHEPEFLFVLRGVDQLDLVGEAGGAEVLGGGSKAQNTVAADSLSEIFGIEVDTAVPSIKPVKRSSPKRGGRGGKGTGARAPASKKVRGRESGRTL
jgi:uncharacterized Zn finger protein